MKTEIRFAAGIYDAIDKSRNPILRSVSRQWRNKIASWVIAEWEQLDGANDGRARLHAALTRRVRAKVKQNVGFPWLPLALFVAQIIIKIIMERWFNGRGVSRN